MFVDYQDKKVCINKFYVFQKNLNFDLFSKLFARIIILRSSIFFKISSIIFNILSVALLIMISFFLFK